MKVYTSEEILGQDDLYDLQDSFLSGATPFKYQMTDGEFEWAKHIKGKYCIADWVFDNVDSDKVLTFNDAFDLSEDLCSDEMPNKAVMLSDETALQKLFFWLSYDK